MRDVLTFDERLTFAAIDAGSVVDFVALDPIEGVPVPEAVALTRDFIVVDITARPATLVSDAGGHDVVVITSSGPAGPPGLGTGYTHHQTTPSASWLVQHNLGCYPAVAVYVDGELGLADVEFVDLNTLSIPFPQATTGIAAIR